MNNRNGNSEPGKGRGWLWGGGAAVLAVVLIIGVAGRGNTPEVQVVLVSRDKLNAAIASNGKVEPVNPYVVRAQIASFVSSVDASEGQAVRKGQRILTLNSSDAQAQLASARADLLSAQSDLRNARAGGSPSEVAQLDGDLGKAQAQVANRSSHLACPAR
jgi:multidrug efflux pump subunit AcrA (membrane-fusion protein)